MSSRSPEGEEALSPTPRPLRSDPRSPGKISRLGGYPCTRWEFGQKIVGEKKRLNYLVYVGYQLNSKTRNLHHLRWATSAIWISEGAPPWAPSCEGLKAGTSKYTWRASMLQMGIQPEKQGARKNDMGASVFLGTAPISLFWGLLIYLFLHIGLNTESRRGQQSWPLSKSGALHKKKRS